MSKYLDTKQVDIDELNPSKNSPMNFIITSGATFSPWDSVRGISNLSKGTTGQKIAEEALKKGHTVDFISNPESKKPFEIKINPNNISDVESLLKYKDIYSNCRLHNVKNFNEYLKTCLSIKNKRSVFVSTAAVSDYAPIKHNGKIRSEKEQLSLDLIKLPKVIKEVKNKNPLMPIVGFKLLSENDTTEDELIDIAYKSLLNCKMSLVVANLVDSNFRVTKTIIITPEKNIFYIKERNDLPNILVNLINERLNCEYYSTDFVDKFPKELDLTMFKKIINDCSHYSLFNHYGDGRKGAEFGSIAMKTDFGILTTGRGTKKKNSDIDDFAVIKSIEGNKIQLSSNNMKATLNAPTLYKILKARDDINFVVHSHVYLANGVFVDAYGAAPGTENDYNIIKEFVLNGANVINQYGHGSFILLKSLDDLLPTLLANGLYNSPYSKYYDIAYHRFEKGSLEENIENLKLNKDIKVLDLACGTGKSAESLLSLGFNNVDIADASYDMLKVAEKRIGNKGVVAKFEDLSNVKDKYDLITIRQAFSYLNKKDVSIFINELKSVLNKNGYLVFNMFHSLDDGITSRYDEFKENDLIIKTLETNIIENGLIIHSQRTEYFNSVESLYLPLYDINCFHQYDLNELKDIFESEGFNVDLIVKNKSACFVVRYL